MKLWHYKIDLFPIPCASCPLWRLTKIFLLNIISTRWATNLTYIFRSWHMPTFPSFSLGELQIWLGLHDIQILTYAYIAFFQSRWATNQTLPSPYSYLDICLHCLFQSRWATNLILPSRYSFHDICSHYLPFVQVSYKSDLILLRLLQLPTCLIQSATPSLTEKAA